MSHSTDVYLACQCDQCHGAEAIATARKMKFISRLALPAHEQAVHDAVTASLKAHNGSTTEEAARSRRNTAGPGGATRTKLRCADRPNDGRFGGRAKRWSSVQIRMRPALCASVVVSNPSRRHVAHMRRGVTPVSIILALERELRRMDADDDEPEVAVFRGPRAHESQRAEPVDAGIRPEIDENDPPTQLRRSERRGIQPAGRPVETRKVTLDGQRGRARMAARAEEAHVRLISAVS
jgi:hypothetical protein